MSFPYFLDLSFDSEKATVDSLGRSSFSSSSPSPTPDPPTPTPTYVWKTNSAQAVDGNYYHFEFRIASVEDGHTEEEITEHFSTGTFNEVCQGKSDSYTYVYKLTGVVGTGTGGYSGVDINSPSSLPVTTTVRHTYGMGNYDVLGTVEIALINDSDSSFMSSVVHFSDTLGTTQFMISVI